MLKKTLAGFAVTSIILAVGSLCAPPVDAQGRGGGGGAPGGGGGRPPIPEEGAASNLSFPVILSDNVGPSAFPSDGAWRFATITDPAAECIGEGGVTSGSPVPPTTNCYYGRHVSVVSETGVIQFDGDPKIWWLQKRAPNFWKAFSVGHNSPDTKLSVSGVDIGDLLESSPQIGARQIRTEFNLLQSVSPADPEFGQFVVADFTSAIPAPCKVPAATGESVGCFAALGMSGAVPGTEQSINEAQGTDFGNGAATNGGTRTFLDPTTVKLASDGTTAIPIHAAVYSQCARLMIQKVAGVPTWDKTSGQWVGAGVGSPLVNIPAYGGGYSVEVNSGGSIVYGYNWNAKTVATGTYRLTFVLDGNDAEGPVCTTRLATQFEAGVTKLVNVGEANKPGILYAGDPQLGDEGGLAYIDVALTTKGGGGGSTGGGGKPPGAGEGEDTTTTDGTDSHSGGGGKGKGKKVR